MSYKRFLSTRTQVIVKPIDFRVVFFTSGWVCSNFCFDAFDDSAIFATGVQLYEFHAFRLGRKSWSLKGKHALIDERWIYNQTLTLLCSHGIRKMPFRTSFINQTIWLKSQVNDSGSLALLRQNQEMWEKFGEFAEIFFNVKQNFVSLMPNKSKKYRKRRFEVDQPFFDCETICMQQRGSKNAFVAENEEEWVWIHMNF